MIVNSLASMHAPHKWWIVYIVRFSHTRPSLPEITINVTSFLILLGMGGGGGGGSAEQNPHFSDLRYSCTD